MSVRLFIEGGGDQHRTHTACRKAFHVFFGKLLGDRPKPRIIASGSRNEAYRDFSRSLATDSDTFAILLVDFEEPIPPGKAVRAHLLDRDGWTETLPEEQVYLMVQCMEAWFLADKTALAHYYGGGFKESALSQSPNIEEIPKWDVLSGIGQATRSTSKGKYHKTEHGFGILERIDPREVQRRSPHADALFSVLLSKLI